MNYIKKIPSLKEKASIQVVINLCQDESFKKKALCLDKSTQCTNSLHAFSESCVLVQVEQWDAAIDEQCQRLTEGFPQSLKHNLHAWICRLALEYLSYCRRFEVLFAIPRQFLVDVFMQSDWTEAGKLNEEKLAKQFLYDERLTVSQRYRIACVYCFHENIPELWKKLSEVQQRSVPKRSSELVLLWSLRYKNGYTDGKSLQGEGDYYLWGKVVSYAVCYGNKTILISGWKMLPYQTRQMLVIDLALISVEKWKAIQNEYHKYDNWRKKLLSDEWRSRSAEFFSLPSYYSELLCFFLSEMHEQQQMKFFKKAFEKESYNFFLEMFLEWPLQEFFLPTISRLWGIVPKKQYAKCLLTLASKYSGNYDRSYLSNPLYKKEDRYFNYGSLLKSLWEETPEEYKRYVFCNENESNLIYELSVNGALMNQDEILLSRILEKCPFQAKDEALFKQIWRDMLPDERMMILHSNTGEKLYSTLLQKENLSFIKWLLEQCSEKADIVILKKRFIESFWGRALCFCKLEKKSETLLEDLIQWSFELDTEKSEFKYKLAKEGKCSYTCKALLSNAEFAEVERIINFCSPSEQMKEQLKVRFIKDTCNDLLIKCAWENMDRILSWNFDTEEKKGNFKKELFSDNGIFVHYELVFILNRWEDVKCFYQWFCLSKEEIDNLKRETIFHCRVVDFIEAELYKDNGCRLVEPLLWCLISEEMLTSLQKLVEKNCLPQKTLSKEGENFKIRLNHLMNKVLCDFRNDLHNKTNRKGAVMNGKVEKRTAVLEDESNLPRKLRKRKVKNYKNLEFQ